MLDFALKYHFSHTRSKDSNSRRLGRHQHQRWPCWGNHPFGKFHSTRRWDLSEPFQSQPKDLSKDFWTFLWTNIWKPGSWRSLECWKLLIDSGSAWCSNVIENLWGFDELRKLFVNVSHYPKQFGSVCFCICIRLLNGSMSEDVDVVINRMSDAKQFWSITWHSPQLRVEKSTRSTDYFYRCLRTIQSETFIATWNCESDSRLETLTLIN